MKKISLLLFFVLFSTVLYAQQRVYCHVTCIGEGLGAGQTTYCLVDIGQRGAASIEYAALRDEQGNIVIFNSPIAVLNILTEYGWLLLGDLKEGKHNGKIGAVIGEMMESFTVEWVMYKELKEGETPEMAYSLFSNAQKKFRNNKER